MTTKPMNLGERWFWTSLGLTAIAFMASSQYFPSRTPEQASLVYEVQEAQATKLVHDVEATMTKIALQEAFYPRATSTPTPRALMPIYDHETFFPYVVDTESEGFEYPAPYLGKETE